MTRTDLITIVRAAMARKGLTQASTADAAGMTAANLSDWLRGVSDVRGDALLRLLAVVGAKVTTQRTQCRAPEHSQSGPSSSTSGAICPR